MADSAIAIAHRGASGYLPEHTLPAKAMAHAMGADFIEQDIVLTSDGVPIVLHDIYLQSTTDVAQQFPDRARPDGRFYAIDFTLAEIRLLRAHERSEVSDSGEERAVFPERYPLDQGLFSVPTLDEEITLIEGLNRSSGRTAGFYIELKAPQFHRQHGFDMAKIVLATLEKRGLATKTEQIYLQCFDDTTLRYLREELRTPLPLIQLIAENAWGEDGGIDYDIMKSDAGLATVATYADGIGPWIGQIVDGRDDNGQPKFSNLVANAKAHGLLVHPYTFRREQVPSEFDSFVALHRAFFEVLGVDGVFTDFPDVTRAYLDQR
ncbi:MAG: glycerophosphodiester phosphodiesterase [Halioglobus sp.]